MKMFHEQKQVNYYDIDFPTMRCDVKGNYLSTITKLQTTIYKLLYLFPYYSHSSLHKTA